MSTTTTPKKEKVTREASLEKKFSSGIPEVWRVYIEGIAFGQPLEVRQRIMGLIQKAAGSLPGVTTLRVTARRRNGKG